MKKSILFLAIFLFSSILIAKDSDIKIIELSLKDEYVLIQNTGSENIDMSGWTLTDRHEKHTYTLYDFTLPVGRVLQMQSGDKRFRIGKLKEADYYKLWTKRNVWNNTGDTAFLYDDKENLVAKFSR